MGGGGEEWLTYRCEEIVYLDRKQGRELEKHVRVLFPA